jgi:rhodanese-related sulfurtransferase
LEGKRFNKNETEIFKKHRNPLTLFLIVISVLTIAVIIEGYYLFQIQNEYNELILSFQTLNVTYYDLLNEFQEFYGNISVSQAKLLIETKPNLLIVDVRFADEYADSHIEGAINICVICNPEKLEELDSNLEILVYCHSGVRSTRALEILNKNGHYKVYNMLGGIVSWTETGYPTIKEE